MNNKNKFVSILIICLLLFITTSCKEKKQEPNYKTMRYSYYSYLDTNSTITVQWDTNECSVEQMNFYMKKIETILSNVEKVFSPEITIQMQLHITGISELMEFNSMTKLDVEGKPIYMEVSNDFIEVLKKSEEISNLLNGYFDVSVGPLTSLWNISNQVGLDSEYVKIPTDVEIQEAVSLINYKNILIDEENNKIAVTNKDMKLDFGAIAKGYACDKVFEYMKSIPYVTICLIDLGGNIYSFGYSDISTTTMAVRNPFYENAATDFYTLLETTNNDCSMVTSGIYERYIVKDNVTYHHLLNPETGYPFDNNIECVTIIGLSSMTCDALATGIYGLGLTEGISIIQSLDDYDAIFVTKDKKVYVVGNIPYTPTEGLEGFEFIDIK